MKLGRRWCLILAASLAAQSDMGNLDSLDDRGSSKMMITGNACRVR